MTTETRHQLPNELLSSYHSGQLDPAMSLLVACQSSICLEARVELEVFDMVGGAILSQQADIPPRAAVEETIFAKLDEIPPEETKKGFDCYPAPLADILGGEPPKWRRIGPGIQQKILIQDRSSSARLLYIEGGKPVPEHSHHGEEFTLVLDGAFEDITGTYRKGDVQIADHELEHQPIALEGEPCICLAVTTDRLQFKSLVPRILQPLFSI